MKTKLSLIVSLLVFSGCENYSSQYETQMNVCAKGEEFGVLVAAVEACQIAADIAETHDFSPALRSQAFLKLASLKRKQGKYFQAENLLRKIITFEKQQHKPDNEIVSVSLLELSLSLAGQSQWNEGADILTSLMSVINELPESKKIVAKNTLEQYSIQLVKYKKYEQAENMNKVLANF